MENQNISLELKKVWTVDDFANYSGYRKSYVYRLACDGKVAHSKPNGGAIFFDRDDVITFLLSKKSKSGKEIDTLASTYVATH